MNTIIIRPVGDEFLVDNFDTLEEIKVKLVISGVEAVALATVFTQLDKEDLDPVCQNIAQTILKRLSERLAGEICSLSR